jgi:uncharacterized protein YjbI with pentapeptide repeats
MFDHQIFREKVFYDDEFKFKNCIFEYCLFVRTGKTLELIDCELKGCSIQYGIVWLKGNTVIKDCIFNDCVLHTDDFSQLILQDIDLVECEPMGFDLDSFLEVGNHLHHRKLHIVDQ